MHSRHSVAASRGELWSTRLASWLTCHDENARWCVSHGIDTEPGSALSCDWDNKNIHYQNTDAPHSWRRLFDRSLLEFVREKLNIWHRSIWINTNDLLYLRPRARHQNLNLSSYSSSSAALFSLFFLLFHLVLKFEMLLWYVDDFDRRQNELCEAVREDVVFCCFCRRSSSSLRFGTCFHEWKNMRILPQTAWGSNFWVGRELKKLSKSHSK